MLNYLMLIIQKYKVNNIFMNFNLTIDEKKLVFNAIKYWQMHKTTFNGNDYKKCDNILNRLFAEPHDIEDPES